MDEMSIVPEQTTVSSSEVVRRKRR